MVNVNIPRKLPQCELLAILNDKASQRHDIDFNFFGQLDNFRQRVSGEILQINKLFPEYTPHDEQYHIRNLFNIADRVLGKDRLEEMHSAELFVLAVALYGHDWGMAVSDVERQYILTGDLLEGNAEDLWILPDECQRFSKFAHEKMLETDADGSFGEISIEIWREYVRQTHAFRSGERVRKFFESIDGGIADAASRVCIGHWADFEDLQKYDLYPPNFSVLGETINLRALAVYLRLIDLLDLAEDRTPYVIWKFVAPRDPYSKMEWKKHRALRPVTCRQYQDGRVIQVDGSTDDHEVYAALEDLRVYCEEQFRCCNDVLAQMNDPRHKLDIYRISWRVAPRGFEPISIQFEFDRMRMFEILGDEIYQGDPYVFLRELLQNSIDAIRMRREVLQKHGIDPGNCGEIHVTVEHGCNGDAIITWRDYGIGMDEYIVRNFLAIAGKSFYQSKDFEREGLKLDPISRFGIGILSCFMVADRIEIETFRDPYLSPQSEPLRIIIPAIHRQFRIEKLPHEGADIGTTVRVFVRGRKLKKDSANKSLKSLDVIAYLSAVAGFVEFPIVVSEGDRKIIILHPKQDAETALQRFGEEFEVHQLDLSFPWGKAFFPQDLTSVYEVLQEKHWDIALDLGLKEYDGVLAYPVPINDKIDLRGFGREGARVIRRGQIESTARKIRWHDCWTRYAGMLEGVSPSSQCYPSFAVYRDGILLAKASPPRDWRWEGESPLPIPKLIVNIPKSIIRKIDLARTQLLEQTEPWALPIWEAHLHHMVELFLEELLSLDPAERLYQLGRFATFHNIEPERLWNFFPHKRWPLLFLKAGGKMSFLEWEKVSKNTIYIPPRLLRREISKIIYAWWIQEEYEGLLTQWVGDQSIVNYLEPFKLPRSINVAIRISELPMLTSHALGVVRFLEPPWEDGPPLVQEVMLPIEKPKKLPDDEQILEKAVENPILLNQVERARFVKFLTRIPRIVEFSQPYQEYFAYGSEFLNLKHPITQTLIKITAYWELAKRRGNLPKVQLGRLDDALPSRYFFTKTGEILSRELSQIGLLAQEMQLGDVHKALDMIPASEEFVPGTYEEYYNSEEEMDNMKINHTFGKPL